MRLVTFRRPGGQPEAGVTVQDRMVALEGAGFPNAIAVLAGGAESISTITNWLQSAPGNARLARGAIELLAPVPRPPKLICVGLNYRDHALETGMSIPERPTIFSKFSSSVIGPGSPILLPKNSTQPDYEAELAFVIGKGGRHIEARDWKQHVFGYTIVNDVSARDFQMATSQWLIGKTFDTFAPMGPEIVSTDEIADPHALDISLRVNGETLQHSNTRELIFKIPELVAYLASVMTLEPGDVVSTGTPSGVGFARKPPRYLKAGDEVIISVEGIGELRNPVLQEA
ncbi:MAG TPA: fumarylacetoacetate hydrolase family protein [Bryobacteraceae bacterium]|nr:fumarylacetoacetate hydrolase family protein [Bryobacteraceae bacterium]